MLFREVMQMRVYKLIFGLILLLALGLPAQTQIQAQTGDWSAWLYAASEGRMTLVNAAGLLDEFIVPLSVGYDAYPEQVIVAPDGLHVAYLARKSTSPDRQLVIYDHTFRAIIATYDLGASAAGLPDFSPNGQQVALGYALNPEGWEIIIIDLPTFTIASALRFDDEAVQAANLPVMLPSIQAYRYDDLIFVDQINLNQGYRWNFDTHQVELIPGYSGSLQPDIFPPTGETLTVQADRLQVYEARTDLLTPFYQSSAEPVGQPHFISNGELILFAEDQHWKIITRDGLPVESGIEHTPDAVIGTPDGFLYTVRQESSTEVYEVTLNSTTPAEARLIHSLDRPLTWQLPWVGSLGGAALFTAGIYPAWAQIAPPEGGNTTPESPVLIVNTPTPAPAILQPGGTAIVNTTNNDALNLRTAAGVEFQIRARLARGTEIDLLEGPVEADGFNWWKVREPGGVEGWVVDFVDGVVTLLPRAVFNGEVDAGDEFAANPTMPSLLQIGQKAKITLSAPQDTLRMRNGAGLNFRVISLLANGGILTVIDGPRLADSLTWWQIRTPDGSVGWAAEIIGSERALTPLDATEPTVSPTPGSTGGLIPPLLVSPLDATNQRGLNVTFAWSPVPGALSYTLTLEACAEGQPTCVPAQPIGGLTTPMHTLTFSQGGTYRWSVTAMNAAGEVSVSETWVFILNP